MATNAAGNQAQVLAVLNNTPALQIGDLDFVRKKYVDNYNACHKDQNGELMYHRNVVHLKQIISSNAGLQTVDKFSVYAVFVTAAVNGYSLDPEDNEVYVIPRNGKAVLDRQAGAYVRRLMRTGQIVMAEQAKLVYEGDDFTVENGRVVIHRENFKSDNIISGYVKVVLDETGKDLHFIYRKSDWESWRKKSPNAYSYMKKTQYGEKLSESLWDNGIIGGTQPEPNFLRTKLVKHAMKEKCWAAGSLPVNVETFSEIEIDSDDDGLKVKAIEYPVATPPATNGQQAAASIPAAATIVQEPQAAASDEFVPDPTPPKTVSFDEDDFMN